MTDIQYINTPEQLEQLCTQINKETWLALDTEFLREKNLLPKILLAANCHAGLGGLR
jgi:ribonuclease D